MSQGLNRVSLIGYLGKTPEVKSLKNGMFFCNLTLATSEQYKDRNTGEKKQNTEWHNVVLFNNLAEVSGKYLLKGSKVYVEGKLQTDKWKDKNGFDRWTTKIIAKSIIMLDSKKEVDLIDKSKDSSINFYDHNDNNDQINDFEDDIPF